MDLDTVLNFYPSNYTVDAQDPRSSDVSVHCQMAFTGPSTNHEDHLICISSLQVKSPVTSYNQQPTE